VSSEAGSSAGRPRAAAAGAVAALVWAAQEPLDRRALRYDYSDVAVLGKALVRGGGWRAIGQLLNSNFCQAGQILADWNFEATAAFGDR